MTIAHYMLRRNSLFSLFLLAVCPLAGCGPSVLQDDGTPDEAGSQRARQSNEVGTDTSGGPDKLATADGQDDDRVQSELIRALLDALEDVEGGDPEQRRAVRRMLREADDELAAAMEGNARRPRLSEVPSDGNGDQTDAGTKPPRRESPYVPPRAIAEARRRLAESGVGRPEATDEAQTPLVRALLEVLDDMATTDDEAEDTVRDALLEADSELRDVLGGNSKRLIERANRRARAPRVFNPPRRPADSDPSSDESGESGTPTPDEQPTAEEAPSVVAPSNAD